MAIKNARKRATIVFRLDEAAKYSKASFKDKTDVTLVLWTI